jgi:hypothetical protein
MPEIVARDLVSPAENFHGEIGDNVSDPYGEPERQSSNQGREQANHEIGSVVSRPIALFGHAGDPP